MNKEIFIEAGERLTLKAYLPIASHAMSLIAEAADGINEVSETLSAVDFPALLNKVCAHMSGAFVIRRTPSHYYQIVYEPYTFSEAELNIEDIPDDLVKTCDDGWGVQSCLWVNEKVLFAFMDRKLYGVAFVLYFYLGHLMTRDAAFAVSHNISFEKILESCEELSEDMGMKHRTTLMRALADLQDTGLIRWNAETRTFEMLHITSYDPLQKV